SFRRALQTGGEAAAEAHFYLAGLYNKQEKYRKAWQELELYLKESKNIKDPPQIKAMIAKLKEKETTKPAQSRTTTEPPVSPVSPPQSAGPVAGAADNSESTSTLSSSPSEPAASPPGGKNKAPEPVPPLSPELVTLLGQSQESGGVMHRRLLDYTYQLKKTRRVLNEHGKSAHVEEQVYEAYPVRGEHVLILLSRDGIPSRSLADDRKRAMKQLEEAERQRTNGQSAGNQTGGETDDYVSAGVSGTHGGKSGYVSINISAFLRSCEFFSPRVETIASRPTIVLNFRPRAGVKLAGNHFYIRRLVGIIWIDQDDKIITRLEGWPDSEAAFDLVQSTAPRDEAALIYQQR